MCIQIYSYSPNANCAFPALGSSITLFAVAPLDQRDKVEIWCKEKNEEAEIANCSRRYKFDITMVEIWS